MHISLVKIVNFRCFSEIVINPQKCHALIGENGSGKTAVLEAINLATSIGGASSKIDEQDFHNADEKDSLLIEVYFDCPFVIKVPYGYNTRDIPCNGVQLEAHRRSKAAPGRALSPQFVVSQTVIPIVYESGHQPTLHLKKETTVNLPPYVKKTGEGYETTQIGGGTLKISARILGLSGDLVGFPNVFYFPKDREKESKTGFATLLKKLVVDLNWRYRSKWNQEEVIRKWEDFYKAIIDTVEDAKSGRIIEPIKERMRDFIGRAFPGLELSLLDLEQPFSKAFFSQRSGTNIIEQNNLGSGVSILLSFFLLEIVSLLSKEEVIILIDEPELHLHPQLQQKFLTAFNEATHQVIYTTQSDCFVDISEWQSINRFRNDHTLQPIEATLNEVIAGKQIREHLNEIKLWHQHKTIFYREDNQVFFAAKCILVEGPADKYGLSVLAERMGREFNGATIMSCNGKSKIPYYQLLCKSYGIAFYTVLDLDGRPETEKDNKNIIDWVENKAVSKFATSFETLLGTSGKEHKTSVSFAVIDSMSEANIPADIKAVIESISAWSQN